jgi:hypothetical protein
VNIPICEGFSIYEVKVADIISVCHQQGVCYAFVEFENSISAQNAIEVRLLTELHSTFVEEFESVCHRKPVMIGEQSQKCQIILLNQTCLFSRPADVLYHYGSSKPVVGIKAELSVLESWDSHAECSSL